jgi:hypothetical protein
MYWTLELASYLSDAPWPANKDELIDYAIRAGAPLEVVENLQSIEDEGEIYESMEEIWPDYPTDEDYLGTRTNKVKPRKVSSFFFCLNLQNYTNRNKNIL